MITPTSASCPICVWEKFSLLVGGWSLALGAHVNVGVMRVQTDLSADFAAALSEGLWKLGSPFPI